MLNKSLILKKKKLKEDNKENNFSRQNIKNNKKKSCLVHISIKTNIENKKKAPKKIKSNKIQNKISNKIKNTCKLSENINNVQNNHNKKKSSDPKKKIFKINKYNSVRVPIKISEKKNFQFGDKMNSFKNIKKKCKENLTKKLNKKTKIENSKLDKYLQKQKNLKINYQNFSNKFTTFDFSKNNNKKRAKILTSHSFFQKKTSITSLNHSLSIKSKNLTTIPSFKLKIQSKRQINPVINKKNVSNNNSFNGKRNKRTFSLSDDISSFIYSFKNSTTHKSEDPDANIRQSSKIKLKNQYKKLNTQTNFSSKYNKESCNSIYIRQKSIRSVTQKGKLNNKSFTQTNSINNQISTPQNNRFQLSLKTPSNPIKNKQDSKKTILVEQSHPSNKPEISIQNVSTHPSLGDSMTSQLHSKIFMTKHLKEENNCSSSVSIGNISGVGLNKDIQLKLNTSIDYFQSKNNLSLIYDQVNRKDDKSKDIKICSINDFNKTNEFNQIFDINKIEEECENESMSILSNNDNIKITKPKLTLQGNHIHSQLTARLQPLHHTKKKQSSPKQPSKNI